MEKCLSPDFEFTESEMKMLKNQPLSPAREQSSMQLERVESELSLMKEQQPDVPELRMTESESSVREGISLNELREMHVLDSIEALRYMITVD